jgi:hypothetical protein
MTKKKLESEKLKMGRPTVYSEALANEICNKIASSNVGTRKLCEMHEAWPSQDTIFTWIKTYPYFSERYSEAKRLQIEVFMDDILFISDNIENDKLTDQDGKLVLNSVAVSRAKLQVDTKKWLAGKLMPRMYGDKVQQEVTLVKHEDALKDLE